MSIVLLYRLIVTVWLTLIELGCVVGVFGFYSLQPTLYLHYTRMVRLGFGRIGFIFCTISKTRVIFLVYIYSILIIDNDEVCVCE